MDNNIILPEVEVIENGKSIPSERIDPNVAAFIMAASQTAQLVKMRKLEESKVPTGTKSLKYTVTSNVMMIRLSPPWIKLSMINDGESEVYISTNEDGEHDLLDQVPVKKNETFNLRTDYPVIKIIWLKTAEGGSANVRIHGITGERR